MLYDKSRFKKINDKKVLHKVRKHWITVSLATLMLLGGAGIVSATTTHASQTGNNNSGHNDNTVLNSQSNHGPQLVNNQPTNQLNQNHTDVSSSQPIANDPNARNESQIHRPVSNPLSDYGRVNANLKPSIQQNSASVIKQRINSSVKQNTDQIYRNAIENWHRTGADGINRRPKQLLGQAPGDTEATEQSKLNTINSSLGSMSPMFDKFNPGNPSNYEKSMAAYSNSATAELKRYSGVENLNDDSADAVTDDNKLNQDISAMPTQSMAINSLNASMASNEVGTLNADHNDDYFKIDNLYNRVNALYQATSQSAQAASGYANDAYNQQSNIVSIFANVSASADSAGRALQSGSSENYPVANVTDGTQMYYAAYDANLHHVNIMNDFDMWDVPGNTTGTEEYWDVPVRNITFNGLNDDGTWNTVDFAGNNIEFYTNYASFRDRRYTDYKGNSMMKLIIKNLHMYGGSYWGPFSINNNSGGMSALNIYDNITYDGSELSFDANSNTNVVFAGKDIVNTGAYSPNGKDAKNTPNGYDYDSGGLNAHPFDGDTGPDLEEPQLNAGAGNSGHNIDDASNQEDMQVPGGTTNSNFIKFNPGSEFIGYTSNGDNMTINGNGHIDLGTNSKVHLIPRGNMGENADLGASMPVGIDINGNGHLNIDNGAQLDITPTDQTDPYNNYSGPNNDYYPGAIHINGNGDSGIHIMPGGVINVKYPTNGKRSLPDAYLYGQNVGYNPGGLITVNGEASIVAERDAQLIVDGGNPLINSNPEYNVNGVNNDNNNGSLVFMAGGNAGSEVQAKTGSVVKLLTGGNQPITLFSAPTGTKITVDDPHLFTLNFSKNSNSNSQLASNSTGIEGIHVNAIDQNNKSFGQYGKVVFPGGVYDKNTQLVKNIIDPVYHVLHHWINSWYGSNASTVWNGFTSNAPEDTMIDKLAQIYPYAESPLSTALGKQLYNEFNKSIDIPKVILDQAQAGINRTVPSGWIHINNGDVSWMLSQLNDDSSNDEPMNYDGQTVLVHGSGKGFNLQHGFTFKGVPNTYIEGIQINGPVISGYAFPGSYIRLNMGGPKGTPIYVPGQTYSDSEYDPDDKSGFMNDYVAIANSKTGYWSYQIPSHVNLNQLYVTAHTQTVSPNEAARIAGRYINGRQNVKQHDTINTADDYDNITGNVYPANDVYDDDYQELEADNSYHVISHDDNTDDTDAGHDFQAGFIKGEHDKDNLDYDNSIDKYAFPFIKGYEIAQGTDQLIAGTDAMKADQEQIDNAVANYENYLHQIEIDSGSADSNNKAMNNTNQTLSQAPFSMYSNLNHTRTSVASAIYSGQADGNNIDLQYTTVSNINDSATQAENAFNADNADYENNSQAYVTYYNDASNANAIGNNNGKQAYLLEADAAQSSMSNDLDKANALAMHIFDSDTSASNDNQSASSDSNYISGSTLGVQTSASNDIASAMSSSANSYSVATNGSSFAANVVYGSVSGKASNLNSTGSIIASEYVQVSSIVSKYPSLSNILATYQVSEASTVASDNNVAANSANGSAQYSNDKMPVYSDSASNMMSDIVSYTDDESLKNRASDFDSASTDNSNAGSEIEGINDHASVASANITSEWNAISGLNDISASVSMSDALSAAENQAQSFVIQTDIDSGIASAESSAFNTLSDDNSATIGSDSGASAAITSDSSIIANASAAVMSDISSGNASDANIQASLTENAESNAESIVTSAQGVEATRVVPITFVDNSSHQIGCSNEAISGHVGGSTITSLSKKAPAPSGYSYDRTAPSSYTFIQNNIDTAHAGYMRPITIKVDGDSEKVPVNFIDEDGNRIYSANASGQMGDTVNVPSLPNNLVSSYNVVPNQPAKYIFDAKNMAQPATSSKPGVMKPYNVYVYENRTFVFDVNVQKYANNQPMGCIDTTGVPITGPDNKSITLDPANYIPPYGFTLDPSDQKVSTKITKTGLSVDMITWKYDALNSSNSNPNDPNAPKPINVHFTDPRNGNQQVGPTQVVNGYMDQWLNILSKVQVPDGYQVVSGTNTLYQIDHAPQDIHIPVIRGLAHTAVMDYVDKATGAPVTQRAIVAPAGTPLSKLTDEYTEDLPYSYQYASQTNWTNSETVVPNGQYVVYVTRINDRPMPVPSDDKPDDNDGRITINYVNSANGQTISSYNLVKPNGTSFTASDYLSQTGNQNDPNRPDDALPKTFINPQITSSRPSQFKSDYDQTLTIKVTPTTPPSEVTAHVQYYDLKNQRFVKDPSNSSQPLSIPITGAVNTAIDYSSYQQFVPQGYRYAGMGSYDNVIEPNDVDVIMVKPAKPAEETGTVTITYKQLNSGVQLTGNAANDHNVLSNPNNYTTRDTLTVSGMTGTPFDQGYYEDDLPDDGTWQLNHVDNQVANYTNNNQNVTMYMTPVKEPAQYSNIIIHFVKANSVTGDGESTSDDVLNQSKWPNSVNETMSSHVGELFDPREYEYNTPTGTRFDRIVKGRYIDTFNGVDQNVYIAVKPDND